MGSSGHWHRVCRADCDPDAAHKLGQDHPASASLCETANVAITVASPRNQKPVPEELGLRKRRDGGGLLIAPGTPLARRIGSNNSCGRRPEMAEKRQRLPARWGQNGNVDNIGRMPESGRLETFPPKAASSAIEVRPEIKSLAQSLSCRRGRNPQPAAAGDAAAELSSFS
jgi:hypothetical protein